MPRIRACVRDPRTTRRPGRRHARPRQRRLPAEGFGFDLNGFAGAPGPRFGPNSVCGNTPQTNPVAQSFQSVAGDVTYHAPRVGNREIDFDTEGLVHIGIVPELIEDVRRDGVSDAELEPLFKSAEGSIRMWEKAERRGRELRR